MLSNAHVIKNLRKPSSIIKILKNFSNTAMILENAILRLICNTFDGINKTLTYLFWNTKSTFNRFFNITIQRININIFQTKIHKCQIAWMASALFSNLNAFKTTHIERNLKLWQNKNSLKAFGFVAFQFDFAFTYAHLCISIKANLIWRCSAAICKYCIL